MVIREGQYTITVITLW